MIEKINNIYKSKGGYAAIAVSMIITVVVGLIVLGFALSSRQQEQRALSNQLGTEAYYAAESAVNDAYNLISKDYAANKPILAQTKSCTKTDSGINYYVTGTGSESLDGVNVSYTCLIVNPNPPTLEYSPILVGHGQVVPIFGVNSSNTPVAVTSITINWQAHSMPTTPNFAACPATGSFPSQLSWSSNCAAPALQIDIAPTAGWGDAASLISVTRTVFLEPSSGGSGTVSATNNGVVAGGKCTPAPSSGMEYDCVETISNLPSSPGNSGTSPSIPAGSYYLHIIPIYVDGDISISANGLSVGLNNAQALVDATAKASGQLKRIQERISINPVSSNNEPIGGLQSTNSICKHFTARPGYTYPSGC